MIFFFLFTATVFLRPEETGSFPPLDTNERFVYGTKNENGKKMLFLYRVNNENINTVIPVGKWENVENPDIQFSGDYKMCFFAQDTFQDIDTGGRGLLNIFDLYLVNGHIGKILYVTKVISYFRISRDGKYLCYISDTANMAKVKIILYDIERLEITGEFEWRPNCPIEGGWYIRRDYVDNTFKIFGVWEGGSICTVAVLNPAAKEFKVLWDKTDSQGENALPHVSDEAWLDDVIKQRTYPNIKIFEEW
jgi:hypothetical protein